MLHQYNLTFLVKCSYLEMFSVLTFKRRKCEWWNKEPRTQEKHDYTLHVGGHSQLLEHPAQASHIFSSSGMENKPLSMVDAQRIPFRFNLCLLTTLF